MYGLGAVEVFKDITYTDNMGKREDKIFQRKCQ